MTLLNFKKEIHRTYRFEKIWFYFAYLSLFIGLGFIFYDALTNAPKYNKYGTRNLAMIGSVCMMFFLMYCVFLIPNHYKILSVTSKHSVKIKQEIIGCLAENALLKPLDREGDIFRFKHSKNWWHNSYTVLICFDADNFYISVQSEALVSTQANGIMDFGGTEKFRKKIKSELEKIVSATPCSEEVSQAFSEPF